MSQQTSLQRIEEHSNRPLRNSINTIKQLILRMQVKDKKLRFMTNFGTWKRNKYLLKYENTNNVIKRELE